MPTIQNNFIRLSYEMFVENNFFSFLFAAEKINIIIISPVYNIYPYVNMLCVHTSVPAVHMSLGNVLTPMFT